MQFKSSWRLAIVSGLFLSTSALASPVPMIPMTAAKNIFVHNNTAYKSTVKVLSGQLAGQCMGGKQWTLAGETKKISWTTVNYLCWGEYPCKAEVYVGDALDCRASDYAGTVSLAADATISVDKQADGHQVVGGAADLTVNQ